MKQGTLNEQLSYWKGQKKTVIQINDYFSKQTIRQLRKHNKLTPPSITFFGKRIKIKGELMNKLVQAAMEKQGFTQASLAKELEKPPETLNRWLKNKQQASKEDIIKLADLLKLPPGVVQFEPDPIIIKTSRKYLSRETELIKNEENLPTNFPSFFEGQRILTSNPNSLKYGAVDLFDMQNKNKCIDERSINAWSICGCTVDGKDTILTGRLMPRSDGELFDITGMWEVAKSDESNNYKGITVNWACPVVVQLEKNFIDTYTNGEINNYSNQGYTL